MKGCYATTSLIMRRALTSCAALGASVKPRRHMRRRFVIAARFRSAPIWPGDARTFDKRSRRELPGLAGYDWQKERVVSLTADFAANGI
jgi:hypothetical protein